MSKISNEELVKIVSGFKTHFEEYKSLIEREPIKEDIEKALMDYSEGYSSAKKNLIMRVPYLSNEPWISARNLKNLLEFSLNEENYF
jgi:hypothetical protein